MITLRGLIGIRSHKCETYLIIRCRFQGLNKHSCRMFILVMVVWQLIAKHECQFQNASLCEMDWLVVTIFLQ